MSSEFLTTIDDLQRVTETGFWEWEPKTGDVRWSPQLYAIFGEDPESFDPTYEAYLDHLHPEDRRRADEGLRAVAESGSTYEHDERVVRSSGTVRWIRCVGSRVERDGKTLLYGTAQDVTAQKLLEKRVKRFQRMEAIARTTSGLAHDFTSLLNVITLCAERLSLMELPDDASDRLANLGDAAERALALSRQLMAVGREAPAEPAELDVAELLRNLEGTLRASLPDGVELHLELDEEDELSMDADPSHVERVLLNLCSNARDALGAGGTIRIGARSCEVDASMMRGLSRAAPGEHIVLVVEDDGEGIDEDLLDHLFEPFITTKGDRGTGLGLATVDGLVARAGGFVSVDSSPGQGTRFEVYWPRRRSG